VWADDHVPPSSFLRISATAFKPEASVPASELTAFGEDDQKPPTGLRVVLPEVDQTSGE
jgi:hypothetical protein